MSEPVPLPVAPDQRPPVDPWWRRGARGVLRRAVDAGLVGTRLESHVVVCGFPRAGSTLLQLMVGACTEGVHGFTTEVDALWAAREAARREPWLVTKRPADVEQVGSLRSWYAAHPGRVRFVVTDRDPRAVLTSRHAAYPPSRGYYVSCARWRRVHRLVEPLREDGDVSVVRFEDLVRDPDAVQARLERDVGWTSRAPFTEAHELLGSVPLDRMTRGALGGTRPPDRAVLDSWRDPAHRPRLREVLEELPELPALLVRQGYAADDGWVGEL